MFFNCGKYILKTGIDKFFNFLNLIVKIPTFIPI